MQAWLFSIPALLLLGVPAWAGMANDNPLGLPEGPQTLLNPIPGRVIRLQKKSRMPASLDQLREVRSEQLTELDKKLTVGSLAVVRNSVNDWNNKVARVIARYDDGARQIQFDNGDKAQVRFQNLITLSPETDKCCNSHGVDVCKDDKIYHPLPSTSMSIPEGKVLHVFENCAVQVRDGLDFIYDVDQLGKSVDCSPQKESVCVGKTGNVDGYRNGHRYTVEGQVTQVYTNGTVLVRSGLWLLPVEATTVRVITEALYTEDNHAVFTSRDGQSKLPVPTQSEIEPFDANDSQRKIDSRGITVPALPGAGRPIVH